MTKLYLFLIWGFVGLSLPACSTLSNFQEEVLFSADAGPDFLQSAAAFGIRAEALHYHQARKRWPRVFGERLKRRALILALGPSPSQFRTLDSKFTEFYELEILNDLLGKNQRKISKFSSN